MVDERRAGGAARGARRAVDRSRAIAYTAAMKLGQRVLDDPERGCWVTYAPDFLAPAEADALLAFCLGSIAWQTESPVMFGRAITVLRRTCAFGDPGTRYRYAGLERSAEVWPPALAAVRERLLESTGQRFDYALGNLYPDGRAGLGWHSDDEDDLVDQAPIASVSLGAPRDFALRLGSGGPAARTLALGHGSLLVMGGATQRHYQHRVPPRLRCREPRVNLTFRSMR